MIRYFRLYLHFLRFSFSKALEFRVDFFFRIVMDTMFYLVNIFLYKVLYLHSATVGGFTESQAMIFVMSYLFLNSLMMTILGNNLWWFPIYINRGDLDYYLIRPVSSQFILSLREIAANSLVNVILALTLLVWAFMNYIETNGAIPLLNIASYIIFLLVGLYLYYLVRMSLMLPVFWTHAGRGFDEIFWNVQHAMQRPDAIFTGWVRNLLTTILPLALMVSYPARILFEGPSFELVGHIIIVTIVYSCFYQWLWRLALKNYSSASS